MKKYFNLKTSVGGVKLPNGINKLQNDILVLGIIGCLVVGVGYGIFRVYNKGGDNIEPRCVHRNFNNSYADNSINKLKYSNNERNTEPEQAL